MKRLYEPRLVKGLVQHARLKPFVHRFRYRAFYLQIPLKSLTEDRAGTFAWGINRPALLSIHSKDHGDGKTPLRQWAIKTLHESGVDAADGEIWLQTFPRMLGYVFKPVSFWFCERADGTLCAIIAEVNNTFGDRHVYVLSPEGHEICNGETLHAEKAFYVSPFFEIRGNYLFRFFKSDLGGPDLARIEYTDNQESVLLTSMSGRSEPLTTRSALMTWFTFPLFSISVIARIHLQAFFLWIKGAKFVSRDQALISSRHSRPTS